MCIGGETGHALYLSNSQRWDRKHPNPQVKTRMDGAHDSAPPRRPFQRNSTRPLRWGSSMNNGGHPDLQRWVFLLFSCTFPTLVWVCAAGSQRHTLKSRCRACSSTSSPGTRAGVSPRLSCNSPHPPSLGQKPRGTNLSSLLFFHKRMSRWADVVAFRNPKPRAFLDVD